MGILLMSLKNGEKIMRKKWIIKLAPEIEKFKKLIWKGVPPEKKIEYAWDMVVEAMELKKQKRRLKFKKVLVFPDKK